MVKKLKSLRGGGDGQALPAEATNPDAGPLGQALRPEDLARFFNTDASAIRRRMSAGEFGRIFHVGRRMFILRAEFDANIDARMNPTGRGASNERR